MANITSHKQRGRGWGPLATHATDTTTQAARKPMSNFNILTFWDHEKGRMWRVSLTDDEARRIVGSLSEVLSGPPEGGLVR